MSAETQTPPPADRRFFLAVGGLLIVIILLLAGLWLRMRRKVIRLQTHIALLQQRTRGSALPMGLRQAMEIQFREIRRDGLPTRPATLDGREVAAFRISAHQAEAFGGFWPGDVILVDPATATAPTQPAELPPAEP